MKDDVYKVKDGLSMTTMAGIKVGGNAVLPKHFAGGEETFNSLVESGRIVKAKA